MRLQVSALVLFLSYSISAFANVGVYSSLEPAVCALADSRDSIKIYNCPGVNPYSLQVTQANGKIAVSVLVDNRYEYPVQLQLGTAAASNSSRTALGTKAEWRIKTGETSPSALIFRVLAANSAEDLQNKQFSLNQLLVIKLSSAAICTVAKVDALKDPTALEKVRQIADNINAASCLK
jgi:hypothetical protein